MYFNRVFNLMCSTTNLQVSPRDPNLYNKLRFRCAILCSHVRFMRLPFLSFFLFDSTTQDQLLFQDPASPIMEGIVCFHHDLMVFLTIIGVFVLWMLLLILFSFRFRFFAESIQDIFFNRLVSFIFTVKLKFYEFTVPFRPFFEAEHVNSNPSNIWNFFTDYYHYLHFERNFITYYIPSSIRMEQFYTEFNNVGKNFYFLRYHRGWNYFENPYENENHFCRNEEDLLLFPFNILDFKYKNWENEALPQTLFSYDLPSHTLKNLYSKNDKGFVERLFLDFLTDSKMRPYFMFKSNYYYNFEGTSNNSAKIQSLVDDNSLHSLDANFYERKLGLLPLHFFVCHFQECKQLFISRLNYILIIPFSIGFWALINFLNNISIFFRNFILKLNSQSFEVNTKVNSNEMFAKFNFIPNNFDGSKDLAGIDGYIISEKYLINNHFYNFRFAPIYEIFSVIFNLINMFFFTYFKLFFSDFAVAFKNGILNKLEKNSMVFSFNIYCSLLSMFYTLVMPFFSQLNNSEFTLKFKESWFITLLHHNLSIFNPKGSIYNINELFNDYCTHSIIPSWFVVNDFVFELSKGNLNNLALSEELAIFWKSFVLRYSGTSTATKPSIFATGRPDNAPYGSFLDFFAATPFYTPFRGNLRPSTGSVNFRSSLELAFYSFLRFQTMHLNVKNSSTISSVSKNFFLFDLVSTREGGANDTILALKQLFSPKYDATFGLNTVDRAKKSEGDFFNAVVNYLHLVIFVLYSIIKDVFIFVFDNIFGYGSKSLKFFSNKKSTFFIIFYYLPGLASIYLFKFYTLFYNVLDFFLLGLTQRSRYAQTFSIAYSVLSLPAMLFFFFKLQYAVTFFYDLFTYFAAKARANVISIIVKFGIYRNGLLSLKWYSLVLHNLVKALLTSLNHSRSFFSKRTRLNSLKHVVKHLKFYGLFFSLTLSPFKFLEDSAIRFLAFNEFTRRVVSKNTLMLVRKFYSQKHGTSFSRWFETFWRESASFSRLWKKPNLHNTKLEVIWTLVPAAILLHIALPSLALLYAMDEIREPSFILKVLGNQWYWTYEYDNIFRSNNLVTHTSYEFEVGKFKTYMDFESRLLGDLNSIYYMLPVKGGDRRLLELDNHVIIPEDTHIRFAVTSNDVLHSWALPSAGIKIDACPGRLNQVCAFFKRCGVFYGQCSEICGVNHAFMPIVVEVIPRDSFVATVNGSPLYVNPKTEGLN